MATVNTEKPKTLPVKWILLGIVVIAFVLAIGIILVNNSSNTKVPQGYNSTFSILNSGTTFSITMPKNYYAYKFETPANATGIYIKSGSVNFTNYSGVFIQNQTQYLNFINNNNFIGPSSQQDHSMWYTNYDGAGTSKIQINSSNLQSNQTYYILFMNEYADYVGYPAATRLHYENQTGTYSTGTISQSIIINYTCSSGYTISSNLTCKPK